jgi:hypothetical protein
MRLEQHSQLALHDARSARRGASRLKVDESRSPPMISPTRPVGTHMVAKNLAELYGLPLVDWQRVEARLAGGPEQLAGTGGHDNRSWLATTNPDGSPHLTGLGPLWVSGLFYFTTGETTRKGRNRPPGPRRGGSTGSRPGRRRWYSSPPHLAAPPSGGSDRGAKLVLPP